LVDIDLQPKPAHIASPASGLLADAVPERRARDLGFGQVTVKQGADRLAGGLDRDGSEASLNIQARSGMITAWERGSARAMIGRTAGGGRRPLRRDPVFIQVPGE
jgi:hypothetical protein